MKKRDFNFLFNILKSSKLKIPLANFKEFKLYVVGATLVEWSESLKISVASFTRQIHFSQENPLPTNSILN